MSAEPLSTTRPEKPERRFVARDGQTVLLERVGVPLHPLADLYHRALVMRWGYVLLLIALGYVLLNLVFALLYLLSPGCIAGARPGHFGDAFAFSVQTFSTIGYGTLAPTGTYANTMVTLEAIVGLIYQALITGIAFAKFARPTARVMFSAPLCRTTWEGRPALMVRTANERVNQVVEARLSLTVLMDETTPEGQHFRRLRELPLVRGSTPIFAVSWTAVHIIDETSPIYGLGEEALREREAQFLATFVGIDDTFNQTVHARAAWNSDDIAWDHHFADIVLFRADGSRVLDLRRFHDVVPDATEEDGVDGA